MTVAAFMDLALYHPSLGYYAREERRSGRTGDFFTSVDVGPAFGDLLEGQIAEMAELLPGPFDLVEAGAGNGRLSADILDAMCERHPALYERLHLHLAETSPAARETQRDVLHAHRASFAGSSDRLPDSITGLLFANELLDAMPVHQVVMRDGSLREVYVTSEVGAHGSVTLSTREGPLSTPALAEYLDAAGARLGPGWRADIGLRAVEWVRNAARRLRRGFLLLIDYGHEATELFSASHAGGTLTAYRGHRSGGPEVAEAAPAWLEAPGEQDLTAHVDFTAIRQAAEEEGLEMLGLVDQTYFLLGLVDLESLDQPPSSIEQIKRRLALKTLLMPGGLGSTMKVLVMGRGVGRPPLRGLSAGRRLT
jgi:SAM-dependent MidA family methyltransferase